jgi:hypothetical protein
MTKDDIAIRKRLVEDFPFYAKHALTIPLKIGEEGPFVLNRAQTYIHEIVEQQIKDVGYVRVLILKGRQQGCSTYVAGRLFWIVTQAFGKRARVMAHDKETSDMLFGMTQGYYKKCPEDIRPSAVKASAKVYDFDELGSLYRVGTAGSGDGGRGGTVQLFHGSEVALWDKADKVFAGVMESVPSGKNIQGTEVFLESTAQGPAGKFYELWQDAVAGKNEYIPIFTPWFWQDEYAIEINPIDNLKFSEDEIAYKERNGINDEQLLWRRHKISVLGETLFKQEYPATADEAFEYSEDGTFFKRDNVARCAEEKGLTKAHIGAKVGALDPAGDGINSDRSAIGYGDDIAIRDLQYWANLDEYQLAKKAEEYIDIHGLDAFWVDAVGLGSGVYAIMNNGRHARIVRPFKGSGSTSTIIDGKEVYENRRAESCGKFREWIGDGDMHQIPNDKELLNDICGPLEFINEKTGKIQVESKKDMKARGLRSPDGLDVCCMIKCEVIKNTLTNQVEYDMVSSNYDPLNEGL